MNALLDWLLTQPESHLWALAVIGILVVSAAVMYAIGRRGY